MENGAMRARNSRKALRFTESVIREMSRICALEGGVNLAQGFPDFPAPAEMKEAAKRAIDADINQYAVTFHFLHLHFFTLCFFFVLKIFCP